MNWNLLLALGSGIGAVGSLYLAKVSAERLEKEGEREYARKVLLGAAIIFLGFYLSFCVQIYNMTGADSVVWVSVLTMIIFNVSALWILFHWRRCVFLLIASAILVIVFIAYFISLRYGI